MWGGGGREQFLYCPLLVVSPYSVNLNTFFKLLLLLNVQKGKAHTQDNPKGSPGQL